MILNLKNIQMTYIQKYLINTQNLYKLYVLIGAPVRKKIKNAPKIAVITTILRGNTALPLILCCIDLEKPEEESKFCFHFHLQGWFTST